MPRIRVAQRPRSLLSRIAFLVSRRRYGKVVGPLRAYALHSPLLYGSGQMELAQDRANTVPKALKYLPQLRVATRVGCPF